MPAVVPSCGFAWYVFKMNVAVAKTNRNGEQDLQTLRSMRRGGSCVSKCHGRSWPHTALCHADWGECWHVKTASIPSRKASFSCLCLTNVTSLAFLVQGHFEKQLVSDFARKNEMSEHLNKNQSKLRCFYGKYPLSCYHGQGVLQLSSIRFWKEIWRCWGTKKLREFAEAFVPKKWYKLSALPYLSHINISTLCYMFNLRWNACSCAKLWFCMLCF